MTDAEATVLREKVFQLKRAHQTYRLIRSGEISGPLIPDATGSERGGFVTADKSNEAFLSLDSQGEQQAAVSCKSSRKRALPKPRRLCSFIINT